MTLNWYAVSGATGYNLYWGNAAGVTPANGTKIAGVTSPYVHGGLTNGATYYYVVTAVNSVGESTASPVVSATPAPTPSGWSSATQLDSINFLSGDIVPFATDINNTGTAVSVWGEGDGTLYTQFARVYQNGIWGARTKLGNYGVGAASVFVTSGGDAFVVYEQKKLDANYFDLNTSIYSQYYDHLTNTWSSPVKVSLNTADYTYAIQPAVVADSHGNALAVWVDHGAGQIIARRFDAALGAWETNTTQLSNSPRSVYTPKIVVDGSDVFTAVWVEDTAAFKPSLPGGGPNHPTPMARRYTATGWAASSQRIGWDPTSFLGDFDSAGRNWVDTNAAGNVFVVWEQGRTLADTTRQTSVDSARFDPVAGTWSATPTSIATNTWYLSWPQVAVDSKGNAMAVWTKTDAVTKKDTSAQTSSFNKTAGTWSTPLRIDQGTGSVTDVAFDMDGKGNAEVFWVDTPNGMTERRYDATTSTWGAFNHRTPSVYDSLLRMSDSGYASLLGQSQTYATTTFMNNAWAFILTP